MPGVLSGAERQRRAAVTALAVGLAAFAVVAAVVVSGGSASLDGAVNEAVAAHRSQSLTDFFSGYTGAGQWFVISAAGVAAMAGLAATSRPRSAAFLAVAVAAALLLDPLLKVIFSRERPPSENAALHVSGLAFPSGHSLASATLALAIVVVAWPTRWRWPIAALAVAFALLMGLSRLYLGVHWLTDVVGAWALALAIVGAAALVVPPRAATRGTTRARRPHAPAAVEVVLVDWGGTLMEDDGTQQGPMATWPHVAAVEGAAEALEALGAAHRIVVATNAEDSGARDVRAALARVDLADLVDDVVSSRDVGAAKPDPFFYRAVLLRHGRGGVPLPPQHAVMVGDSWTNDVEGARLAGVRAIWFNPSRSIRPAGAAPPDGEITRLRDLPRAVAALEGRTAAPQREAGRHADSG